MVALRNPLQWGSPARSTASTAPNYQNPLRNSPIVMVRTAISSLPRCPPDKGRRFKKYTLPKVQQCKRARLEIMRKLVRTVFIAFFSTLMLSTPSAAQDGMEDEGSGDEVMVPWSYDATSNRATAAFYSYGWGESAYRIELWCSVTNGTALTHLNLQVTLDERDVPQSHRSKVGSLVGANLMSRVLVEFDNDRDEFLPLEDAQLSRVSNGYELSVYIGKLNDPISQEFLRRLDRAESLAIYIDDELFAPFTGEGSRRAVSRTICHH